MPLLKFLRLLSDPNRVRIVLLLARQELSVAELQEILAKGQSHISTHLALLKRAGLIEDRRTGKNIFYKIHRSEAAGLGASDPLLGILQEAAAEIPEAAQDHNALLLVLEKRKDRMRAYFDGLAGRFGRAYLPGRSWQGLAEALLSLMPPMVVADLGAGEGNFSQLLARRASKVIAVDHSEKMIEYGLTVAGKHGVANLEYRRGDLEAVPIEDQSVDIAFFSQSLHHAQQPAQAIREAWRILKPGGQIAVLDLMRHQFEEARELYADVWLGFTETELRGWLNDVGFSGVHSSVVHREADAPHFETLLATAVKTNGGQARC